MLFLATFLIAFALTALLLGLFRTGALVKKDKYGSPEANLPGVGKLVAALVLSFVLALLNPISVERIDVGNVGLKVNNTGDDRGLSKTTYVTGWVFYNAWLSRIIEYPVTQQHVDYEPQQIITKGGFTATIRPSFNWSVNPATVADMYQSIKKDTLGIKETWLKTAVVGAINDVANRYTVDSIFNHREHFENEIKMEARKRVAPWFNLDNNLRTGIVPPDAITKAINAKTAAVQEAQAALQQKLVAEAQAQEKIARAKGDSAEAVIAAAGRAQAVRLEQQQLTPLYIDYLKVTKWKGDVPQTVLGANAAPIISLK